MKTLSLTLLGPFHAALGPNPLTKFRTNRVQALLIYLAVEQKEQHRREALMELLWPGLPQKSAQVNLRQTLYQLRKMIPEVLGGDGKTAVSLLITDRQTIQIHPDAAIDLDLATFDKLAKQAEKSEEIELLAQAAALYRGDFLADFYLPDSETFEEWANARREAYRRQVLDVLQSLAACQIEHKQFDEAETAVRRQLTIDPLRDIAHRQLIELLARSGRRSDALAHYDTYCRLLADELGVEPSTATLMLHQQITSGQFDTKPANQLRGYLLGDEIGSGAFGVVYRAEQPAVQREVAIKIIAPQHANQPDFIRHFEAEARIIARLEHPYIVPLYDYWREPDGAYLVMRYLRGGSLRTLLKNGACNLETAVYIIDQITAALTVAHSRGIVHRDIKPANILLDEEGNAYLSDFGIAKEQLIHTQITQQDAIIGTPAYMSPEQALGQEVTPQADIYSLGVVLYEILTGAHPFGNSNTPITDLIYKHMHESLPSVCDKNPTLPPAVDNIIQQATTKSPDRRFPNTRALANALRETIDGKTIPVTIGEDTADLINPYKGLHPFEEADAANFFGRTALVEQLLARMADPDAAANFLAVVGPSGSGKSSVVKAGLLPALRQGMLPGSDQWFVVNITPGTQPIDELEIGLLRVAARRQAGLGEQLQRDAHGLLRAARLVLPDDDATLLLVVDQFEELYTAVTNPETQTHFLNLLTTAATEPNSPLRLVITLRADFYDRPLLHPEFGQLMRTHTEVVLPLTAAELSKAIRIPAERAGAKLEAGLATTIVADVADQPGALPMLQYALTELFNRRDGQLLTKSAYQTIGKVTGALARRAEEIYTNLDPAIQETTQQLFLRLVTLGEGVEDTRRRVLRSELVALQTAQTEEPGPVNGIIDAFGQARLLTFDHDPNTREPTVELAHEALLSEWPRLRTWLDESRDDVRMQRQLAAAANEWQAADQDSSYLIRGAQLDLFAEWITSSVLSLTQLEKTFLETSLSDREARRTAEETRRQRELETAQQLAETERQRAEEQTRSTQRLRRRALYLAGALLIAALLAIAAIAAGIQANNNANTAATEQANAQANAALAATREEDAVANAALASTREAEAVFNENLAETRQVEAETEAYARATAEAIANQERETAEEQARIAFSRELVASSILNLDDDPHLSILLALHALAQTNTIQAQEVLHAAVQNSRLIQRVPNQPDLGFYDVLYSPDGSRLSVVTFNPQVGLTTEVRDAKTLEVLFTLNGGFFDDRWTDGDRIHTWKANLDQGTITISILDGSGQLLSTTIIPVAWADVAAWDVSSDMKVIAIGKNDGSITLYDLETGDDLQTFGHPSDRHLTFGGLVFSPDGTLLGSNSLEEMSLWETTSGRALLTRPTDGGIAIAFSLDGKQIAFNGGNDGQMTIIDIASGQDSMRFFGHTAQIASAEFNADGTRLVTAASDGTARIWDTRSGENLLKLRIDTSGNIAAAFSPDDTRLVTATNVGDLQVWGISPEDSREWLTVSANGNCGATFSPDSTLLAVPNCDDSVRILDAISGQTVITLTSPTSTTAETDWPAFSADGKRLAAVKTDDTVVVWDVETGQETLSLSGHSDRIYGVAFNPNGTQLATISYDKTARLWDATSGNMLYSLDIFTNTLTVGANAIELAFSPDGSKLATAGDVSVKIWDTVTGAELLTIPESEVNPGAYTVAFSPDGTQVAAGLMFGAGGRVWDAATGQKLFDLSGHTGSVTGIAYSPDGRQIATTSVDGTTRLWDAATGVAELILESRTTQGSSLAYSPDGKRLATQYAGGMVRIYALNLEDLVKIAHSRLSRWFTPEECQQYLHTSDCPPAP